MLAPPRLRLDPGQKENTERDVLSQSYVLEREEKFGTFFPPPSKEENKFLKN